MGEPKRVKIRRGGAARTAPALPKAEPKAEGPGSSLAIAAESFRRMSAALSRLNTRQPVSENWGDGPTLFGRSIMLAPGWVVSQSDGGEHYLGARLLAHLYGISRYYDISAGGSSTRSLNGSMPWPSYLAEWRAAEARGCIFLVPRDDGMYHVDTARDAVYSDARILELWGRADPRGIRRERAGVRPQNTDDLLIPWNGGVCPVPLHCVVEVRFADGGVGRAVAGAIFWGMQAGVGRVVSYRVLDTTGDGLHGGWMRR